MKWINVTERNPDKTGKYKTKVRIGSMTHKVIERVTYGKMTEHRGFRWMEGDWEKVIEWMPLPEPPKGE